VTRRGPGRYWTAGVLSVVVLATAASGSTGTSRSADIIGIRELKAGKNERIIFRFDRNVEVQHGCLTRPDRLYFDFHHTGMPSPLPIKAPPTKLRRIRQIRWGHRSPETVRAVLEVRNVGQYVAYKMSTPPQLVVELMPGGPRDSPCHEGARERAVTLADAPVVVVDPGHGGRDEGERGSRGISEAQVALVMGRKLAILLRERGEAEVLLTRQDDRYVPLTTRNTIAKEAAPDVFVSLHAEAGPADIECRPQTYYLALTNSQNVLQLAARENAVNDHTVFELPVLITAIMREPHTEASRDLAQDILRALPPGKSRRKIREVQQARPAPLTVLMGLNSPGAVVSLGCLKNRRTAEQLRSKTYQNQLAHALYTGISDFLREKKSQDQVEQTTR
jgi:N-acetylmuramoyl-L-alanine amidase